jgi:hypothetical protein
MLVFGVGNIWATQNRDSSGVLIANPTPYLIGTPQSFDVEIKQELKTYYGSKAFPQAVAKGKGSVSGKVSFGDIAGSILALLTGDAMTAGVDAVVTGNVATSVPVSGNFTVVPPSSGTFKQNLGVINAATGFPLLRVASAPAAGEYTVNAATGAYAFNAAQATAGLNALIAFSYTATSTAARRQTVLNPEMGITPSFQLEVFQRSNAGGYQHFRFFETVFDGLKFGTKNDDFQTPETSFQCFSNAAGQIYEVGFSE